jgi:hypothetical protein
MAQRYWEDIGLDLEQVNQTGMIPDRLSVSSVTQRTSITGEPTSLVTPFSDHSMCSRGEIDKRYDTRLEHIVISYFL